MTLKKEVAKRFINEMLDSGYIPDLATYNRFLKVKGCL